MKIYLTDICSQCCPEMTELGEADRTRTERVKARVFEQLGAQPQKRSRKSVRTFFLIAAAAALLGTAAYAISNFVMDVRAVDETVSGHWTELDENGEVIFDQTISFPDAGMVFSFTGPEEHCKLPEFRAFYLPSEASFGLTDEEGWTGYLSDNGSGASLPYIISATSVPSGNCRYVLNGEPSVIKEEYWGDWYVLEVCSDYRSCTGRFVCEEANYIFLFDEARGYLVLVSGSSDMDTLERIAKNLEIRESDKPYKESPYTEVFGCIDIGRG